VNAAAFSSRTKEAEDNRGAGQTFGDLPVELIAADQTQKFDLPSGKSVPWRVMSSGYGST
jgi:hypothetical protein